MKKITHFFSCLLFLLCFMGGNAQAQLFTDQFNYTSTGTLAGDSLIRVSSPTPGTPTTGIWKGHSGYSAGVPTNPQMQTATSLTYSSAPTLGGAVSFNTTGLDVNASFTAQTSGSVYASAIVSVATAQAGDYFLHLGQTSSVTQPWNVTNFTARVFARSSGTGFQLGLTRSTTAPTYGTTVYPFNIPIFIVIKHSIVTGTTNDQVFMYVYTGNTNPPTTEPGSADFSVTTETGTDPADISKFVIRQGSGTTAPTGLIDYIRVGTAWADVTSFAAAAPSLIANPTTIGDFGSVNNMTPSPASSYTLTASNLTADVTVTAPTNFQVAKGVAGTYGNSVTYTIAELATMQTVGVRFLPSSGVNGVKSGNITHSGFTAVNVAVSGTETGNAGPTPTLTANPISLPSFGNVNTNASSTASSYTLTASNLTADVVINAPTNFEIAKGTGGTYGNSVTYTIAELATMQTVGVIFKPTSGTAGTKSGNITHSNFAGTTVAVSGTEVVPTPTLVANPMSLANFGSVANGANSTNATYTLTATNLTNNVLVTAPANFRVSKDNGTTFAQTITYTVADLATMQTVTVRFQPTSGTNGAKSGNITHSGFTAVNVAVSGTETGNAAGLTTQINVKQGTTTITSGGNYVYPAGQSSVTFTIENLGNINLALNTITTTGANGNEFAVIQPSISNVAGGANTTFVVNINPSTSGNKVAVLNIPSNDTSTPNYTINLSASNVTALPTQLQVGELNLYPNPSNGNFRIKIGGEASRKVSTQVFDAKGNLVNELKGETTEEGIFNVDFSTLPAGIYNVVLQVGKEKILKRIVVE